MIPYILVSLITALGRLTLADAKSLGLKAGAILLVPWGVGLAVVLLTPLRHGDVIRTFRGPLVVAFATGNILITLPILAADCKTLLEEKAPQKTADREVEAESSVDVLIPAAFLFPNLGLVPSLMFVLFAGWNVGSPVSPAQYPAIST